MNDLQSIIGDYGAFLTQIIQETEDEGFDLNDFVQMDHMCYRVPSLEQYKLKKKELAAVGDLLGEQQVNGRPIVAFRLRQPVLQGTWRIDCVELPAPRPGSEPKEGLEHVEFVLYDDKEAFLQKYAGKPFNLDSAERGINPEIGYKLPSGHAVKFHLLNLPTVIYLERKLGITNV